MTESCNDTRGLARTIRVGALTMAHIAQSSHIGSCLSIADILAVLYGCILRVDPSTPDWPDRDRFILSKGHAAAALYAALAARGYFPVDWLKDYCRDGSLLLGHASHYVPGVELSTGSLGHGLPVACGMSLAAARAGWAHRVFVLLSDGELDEGSNWEAILFACQHRLDNLVAIVDYNGLQGFGRVTEVANLHPLVDKWQAFGWGARSVDGHDHEAIREALGRVPFDAGRPSVLIAHTVKGQGVSFTRDQFAWHYRSPNAEQLRQALAELGVET